MRKMAAAILAVFALACIAHRKRAESLVHNESRTAVRISGLCEGDLALEIDRQLVHLEGKTRLKVSRFVLLGLASLYEKQLGPNAVEEADALAYRINVGLQERRIELAGETGSCSFTSNGAAKIIRLQLSGPLSNPYSPQREKGVIARVSFEGAADTWFWVEIDDQPGTWVVREARRLPIDD